MSPDPVNVPHALEQCLIKQKPIEFAWSTNRIENFLHQLNCRCSVERHLNKADNINHFGRIET